MAEQENNRATRNTTAQIRIARNQQRAVNNRKDKDELMLQAWFQANTEIMFWNQLTNDKFTEISKQLLGIAFILIPLSGSIVFTDIYISDVLKQDIIIGLGFISISIVLGLIQMYINANFFSVYMQDNIILSNIFKSHFEKKPLTIKKALALHKEEKTKKNISPKPNPNPYCGAGQVVSITIGTGFLLWVVVGLLYSNTHVLLAPGVYQLPT